MYHRGPYKQYLQDGREIIQATTIHSRHQREILQGIHVFHNQVEDDEDNFVIRRRIDENIEDHEMAAVEYLSEDLNYGESSSNDSIEDDSDDVDENINDEDANENVYVVEAIEQHLMIIMQT